MIIIILILILIININITVFIICICIFIINIITISIISESRENWKERHGDRTVQKTQSGGRLLYVGRSGQQT